jgi:transposase
MSLAPLGIDIAKVKFSVCLLLPNGKLKHKVFTNNQTGFAQLQAWLMQQSVTRVHACLEATGSYGEALALYLHEQKQLVSVVNPAAVKAFAASCLSRTKTDRVDAELIARFCLAQEPPAWEPPAVEVRELQALVRRLAALIEMRVAEENRLAAGPTIAVVRRSLEESIRAFAGADQTHRETNPHALGPASRLATTTRSVNQYSRDRRDDGGVIVGGTAALETVSQCTTSSGAGWSGTT